MIILMPKFADYGIGNWLPMPRVATNLPRFPDPQGMAEAVRQPCCAGSSWLPPCWSGYLVILPASLTACWANFTMFHRPHDLVGTSMDRSGPFAHSVW